MRLAILGLVTLLLTGCEFHRAGGPCVGLWPESNKRPGVEYEISIRNAVVTVIFSETFGVPVVWALTSAQCPVEK